MLDIAIIRNTPRVVVYNLHRRQDSTVDLDRVRNLDQRARDLMRRIDELRHERNQLAKEHGDSCQGAPSTEGDRGDRVTAQERGKQIKRSLQELQEELDSCKQDLQKSVSCIPNLLLDHVPDEPQCIRSWGVKKDWDFAPKPHYELLTHLMDFETAQRISGAKFVLMRQDLATLERALVNFLLDHAKNDFNFSEVSVPLLVKTRSMYGTGQLPKFRDDQFQTQDDLWLIPTAEVSVTNICQNQTVEKASLPLRWVASTPCFRREAGAAGSKTRGLIRQHQFLKVEMVSIVNPEIAMQEWELQVQCAERALQKLGLHYRTVLLPSHDVGFSARSTYDIEVYLEGDGRYCEISSCSYCGDFQARRLRAKYTERLPDNRTVNRYVHTINGSCVAIGRLMAAIMERYQQMDGHIEVPEALWDYMGQRRIL